MAHENPLTSWDDYPVHQSANFIAHTASSDRNFYDRYYFFMHPSSGEMAAIFGLGQYPNLGVTDAFVAVCKGGGHHVVRASKPLVDRMDTSVGPIRVEIIEPLRRLRVVVEPTEHSVSMDVTWTGSVPAIAEPNQFIRSKGKVVFDTQRLAQTGFWEGSITVNGETTAVTPDHWRGARDRSWGVRPVGEPEPAGIRQGVPVDERHVELLPHAIQLTTPSSSSTTSSPTAPACSSRPSACGPMAASSSSGASNGITRCKRARG